VLDTRKRISIMALLFRELGRASSGPEKKFEKLLDTGKRIEYKAKFAGRDSGRK